jgi:predicted deacetylase
MTRLVSVALHDVAPATRSRCERLLEQVERIATDAGVSLRVTLLAVPMMHGALGGRGFGRWLHALQERGHEVALHGFTHEDATPVRSLADYALRRWYTAGEGEFAALGRAEADHRLSLGLAWAQAHGLAARGFVAPAWLMSEAAWHAVVAAGFDYSATLTRVVLLPERQPVAAPSLVFSTRAPWRRVASLLWNRLLAALSRRAPLLRLELHPNDGDYPAVQRCWAALLADALRERRPLPLGEAAAALRHPTPSLAAPSPRTP